MAFRAALSSSISRISSPSPAAATLIPRRGLSGGGDHHGPTRINIWNDPLSPSKWKEEHFVLVSLSGWLLLIYGGVKAFSGPKEKKEQVVNHHSRPLDVRNSSKAWMHENKTLLHYGS